MAAETVIILIAWLYTVDGGACLISNLVGWIGSAAAVSARGGRHDAVVENRLAFVVIAGYFASYVSQNDSDIARIPLLCNGVSG